MTAWLPSDAATTLAFWFDPNDTVKTTVSGGVVTTATDKSANGFVLTPNGPSATNTLTTTTVNGNRALQCTPEAVGGAFRALSTASNNATLAALTNAANTFAGVASRTFISSSNVNAAFSHFESTNRVYAWLYDDTGPLLRARHGSTSTAGLNATSALTVLTHSSTALNTYVNGTADVSNTTASNFTMSTSANLQIGGNTANAWSFLGWVGDCIIYAGVLSTGDRQKLEGYLAWKWGLVASLPAGHPYKSAAPTTGGTAYTLTAAAGSFSLSGQTVGLKTARKITAALGTFSLSGKVVALIYGRKLTASAGALTLSGLATGLRVDRRLSAGVGAFALSGKATVFTVRRYLVAGTGSLTLNGQATGLRADRRMAAAVGSYALSGQATGLKTARRLAASVGVFALNGQAAGLSTARRMSGSAGSFVVSRLSATLTYQAGSIAYTLTASAGSFLLNGQDAGLLLSSLPVIDFYPRMRRIRRC